MIGIFDSGFGGLTILKELASALPKHSYIYYGDNKRAPYGAMDEADICKHTIRGVEELFARGAKLIILACNTSSAVALKKIQQELLPMKYPDKKVLGIIIPTAEESDKFSKTKHIGLWATEATVNSEVYIKEVSKIDSNLKIIQLACPLLVPLIEAGSEEYEKINHAIKKYVSTLLAAEKRIDTLILGCTHFAILENEIRKLLPEHITLITQGKIVAEKLKNYLVAHEAVEKNLGKQSRRIFLTTEDSPRIKKLTELFYGEKIDLEVVDIA